MEVKNITVFGKNYMSAPMDDGCSGCAFDTRESRCAQANIQVDCDNHNIIWTEEQDSNAAAVQITQVTYTEDQIRFGLQQWYGFNDSIDFLNVMKKYSDPDYARYLELKEKFNE